MGMLSEISNNLKSSFIFGMQLLYCLTNVLRSVIMDRFFHLRYMLGH